MTASSYFLKVWAHVVFWNIMPYVLSDTDIRHEVDSGGIRLPEEYMKRIRTASIDLAACTPVKRSRKRLFEVFDDLDMPFEHECPRLKSNADAWEPHEGVMEPGFLYYSVADVPLELREGLKGRVTTRSSLARLGLFVASPGIRDDGKIPLVIKPYTKILLPEGYRICQMIVYEDGLKPLSRDEVLESMKAGDIAIDGRVDDDGSVAIHFHHPFYKYDRNGGVIDPRSNGAGRLFIETDMSSPLIPGVLYLAMTEEIELSDSTIGMIENPAYVNGRVHANAPAIKPGSRKQQALELISNEPYGIIEGGEAGHIKFYRTRSPATNPYNGKYENQTTPVSRSHGDFPQ